MAGPVLMPSTRKGKRFMVLVDGKAVHFGSAGGKAFIDHGSTEKKSAWIARHGAPAAGQNWADPYTAGYWAKHVLWGESPDLQTAFAAAVKRAGTL